MFLVHIICMLVRSLKMRTKAFGEENMAHLSAYYYSEEKGEERKLEIYSEEKGEERKLEMEEYLKNLDSKKFKEFMEWKEEMEQKFPFIRDALLGKKAPPLHWEVKEDSKKASIFNNILTKIKDKFAFLFDRDCFI